MKKYRLYLIIIMLLIFKFNINATEITDANINQYAIVDESYSINIPKEILIDEENKLGQYTISINGDIPKYEEIVIEPNMLIMHQNGKEDIILDIQQDKTTWTSELPNENANGIIDATNLTAGTWNGSFSFNISKTVTHTHNYEETITKEATCTEEGIKTFICECNDSYTEKIEILGHDYKSVVIEATCTTAGSKLEQCNRCNSKQNITEIPATGHTSINGGTEEVHTKCSVCDETLSTVHEYSTEILVETTCTENGIIKYTCDCGYSYQEFIEKLEHDYTMEVSQEATCTENGINVYTCKCGKKYLESTDKLGHVIENGCCTRCGEAIECVEFELTADNYEMAGITREGDVVIPKTFEYNDTYYITTSIGAEAFDECDNLNTVIIPDSVTVIKDYAFYGCDNLTTIQMSDNITTIGKWAFSECTNLTNINLSNNITNIDWGLFDGCSSLTNIKIPNKVTRIGTNAFKNCSSLTNIEIPESVTSIENYVFDGCINLNSIKISNNVTSIGTNAFLNIPIICYNGPAEGSPWGALQIHNYENDYCTICGDEIEYVEFELTADNYEMIGITGEGDVIIPRTFEYDGVKYKTTSIGEYAFYECYDLISVNIPDSVTIIKEEAFFDCDNLVNINIPNGVTEIGYDAFCECDSLTELIIPDSVTTIGAYAFCYTNLENVVLPKNLTNIGEGLFEGCKNLKTVTISDNVTSIENYAFWNCENLRNIMIPNSVINVGSSAFENCYKLSIEIPENVTTIGKNAFFDIANIIYNGNAESSPWGAKCINGYIENDFVYTDENKTILCAYIGTETDVIIPESVVIINNRAFYANDITSVVIGNNVTEIGDYAFDGCEKLQNISIPNSVITIGERSFAFCLSLTEIEIPNSITTIKDSAFYHCTKLSNVEIPSNATTIGKNAFYKVPHITYNGSVEGAPWGALSIN